MAKKKAAHKPEWATRKPVKKSAFKKATPEELGPEQAAELLKTSNREPKPEVVEKYTADMKAGKYVIDNKTAPTRRWVKKTAAGPHVMLKALAGTGKTFSQVEAACRLINGRPTAGVVGSEEQEAYWAAVQQGEPLKELLAVAFNKSIAKTLEQRMPASVTCKTMHGLGYSTITRALNLKKLDVNEYKVEQVLEDVVCKPGQTLHAFRKERPMLLNNVRSLCDLARQNLLGFDDSGRWSYTNVHRDDLCDLIDHYGLEVADRDLSEVLEYTVIALLRCAETTNVVDYCDMVWLPLANSMPFRRFDALLGDEVQDWSKMMQAFALKSAGRLFLCGDENQAIYGFAGADADSMPRMQRILEADKRGCMVMPLTETRRCGKAVVDLAKSIVPSFRAHESNGEGEIAEVRDTELWKATRSMNNGGLIQALSIGANAAADGDSQTEADAADAVGRMLDAEYIAPGDMILCRMNAPLISACFRLLRMGVPATIQGRDIGVSLVRLLEQLCRINHAGEYSDTAELGAWLDDWYHGERAKLEKKKFVSEAKLIALTDKHECLLEFARDPECKTVYDVKRRIERIFTDEVGEGTEHAKPKAKVLLSSVHRAKGLEAEKVFIIAPEFMPHPMAKQEWEMVQERNLKYVAITRAIHKLIWVKTAPTEAARASSGDE